MKFFEYARAGKDASSSTTLSAEANIARVSGIKDGMVRRLSAVSF
jgi:hypothetical protein